MYDVKWTHCVSSWVAHGDLFNLKQTRVFLVGDCACLALSRSALCVKRETLISAAVTLPIGEPCDETNTQVARSKLLRGSSR
jgi:hypothetical protein